ncbi:MAG: hypothetical protein UHX00_07165 [Caryophanon sp.]|nr:hypothetical protein [Caryophanon sp.]
MFVIASTRPLPIHYEQASRWMFKRGIYAAREVYHPFFVEVERGVDVEPLFQYVERFIQQYTKYELAVHVHDWHVVFLLQQRFRHAIFAGGIVLLKR